MLSCLVRKDEIRFSRYACDADIGQLELIDITGIRNFSMKKGLWMCLLNRNIEEQSKIKLIHYLYQIRPELFTPKISGCLSDKYLVQITDVTKTLLSYVEDKEELFYHLIENNDITKEIQNDKVIEYLILTHYDELNTNNPRMITAFSNLIDTWTANIPLLLVTHFKNVFKNYHEQLYDLLVKANFSIVTNDVVYGYISKFIVRIQQINIAHETDICSFCNKREKEIMKIKSCEHFACNKCLFRMRELSDKCSLCNTTFYDVIVKYFY